MDRKRKWRLKKTHVTTTLPWMSSSAKLGVGPSSSLVSAAAAVDASAEPASLPPAPFVPALFSSFVSLSLAVGDEP